MMTLPHFTNANPTDAELLAEQKRLHTQADKMMKETAIAEFFAKHGDFLPVGGSYAYGLMVWPDLDFGVVSDRIDREVLAELLQDLARNKFVRKISVVDRITFDPIKINSGLPKGLWVGLEIPFEGDRWSIDCWLMQTSEAKATKDQYAKRLAKLDETGQLAVLQIKYDLIRRGLYGKTYGSSDVYDAVLDKGVRSIEDFEKL